LRLRR